MTTKVVQRLHTDIQRLHRAQKKRHLAARELRKDTRELKSDKKQGDKLHDKYDAAGKALKKDRNQLSKLLTSQHQQLDPLDGKILDAQAQYDASIDDATGQGDPALKAQLDALQQQKADVQAKFQPKLDATRADIDKQKAARDADHKAILAKRHEIKKDRNEIKHDKKVLARDQKQVKNARHKALKDLQPAEYKMGLKGTNKVRQELGLKKVDHVIRPAGPGHVTATMRKLARAGRAAAMSMGGYVSHGLCATGVSRAIRSAMGLTVYGNGNQIDNNLPRSKFKQIHIPLSKALKIPGLILTWEHTSTVAGSKYGHTAITLGDGHSSASDFIENNTLAGAASRTGLKIFIPR